MLRHLTLAGTHEDSISYRTISLVVLAGAFATLLLIAPDVLFGVFFRGGGSWIARHTGLSGGWGIGLFIALILLKLGGALAAFAPAMSEQFDQLTEEIPSLLRI